MTGRACLLGGRLFNGGRRLSRVRARRHRLAGSLGLHVLRRTDLHVGSVNNIPANGLQVGRIVNQIEDVAQSGQMVVQGWFCRMSARCYQNVSRDGFWVVCRLLCGILSVKRLNDVVAVTEDGSIGGMRRLIRIT